MFKKKLNFSLFILISFSLAFCTACGKGEHTHAFSSWQTVKLPTCYAKGLQQRECVECGFAEYFEIATTEHTIVVDEGKNASCTEEGKTEGSHCEVCKKVIVPSEKIAKAEHKYESGVCECGAFDEVYCSDYYVQLKNEMLTMDNKVKSLELIKEYLEKLPHAYKDVDKIFNEYLFIKSQYDVFTNALFCNLMKTIIGVESEEYDEYRVDYAQVRRAYFNLIDRKDVYSDWDIVGLADDYVFDGDGNGILLCIVVGLWEDDAGNYVNIVEKEDNSLGFGSNIPRATISSEQYYYFIDGRVIGYVQKDDTDVKINAYRITEIGKDFIKVYCFDNNRVYVLNQI